MPLAAGDKLGPYEILAPIGKGGMGEVWKALDTRLGRDVAIKISAEQFSERFEREARAVAALNHPNICTLYDVGANYLVMEYIEGPTLAERIKEGPIPLEDALRIAGHVADALEAAHDKNIIHRDLKPGNIKIKPDGTVKVLDFGLAKIGGTPGAQSEDSPTLTMTATQAGMILGTAAYMSPEQARGQQTDKRSDIWAFGVVMFEMLTGARLFKGATVSDVLAAVLRQEPDWDHVPGKVRRLLRRCLEKDPQKRLRDISGVALLLEEYPQAESARHSTLPWAAAVALLLALGTISFVHFREKPPAVRTLRYTIAAPEGTTNIHSFALSPDGRYLAIATTVKGKRQLWLRPLDALEAQPMPGTDDATFPFWSPDSRYIGFFAQGKLKKIVASGGPAQTLCDANNGRGGSWSREDTIVFAPGASGAAIQGVPAAGGAPSDVSKGKHDSRYPLFLPGGTHFLYVAAGTPAEAGVYVSSLGRDDERRVLTDASSVVFAGGHLFFLRENALMAQPFDPTNVRSSGEAFPIAEGLSFINNLNFAPVSVSQNGVLVYANSSSAGSSQIVWFDRAGKVLGTLGPPGAVWEPAISPDQKQVAFRRSGASTSDLWLHDLARGRDTRFTFDASTNLDTVWSPQGDRILFNSNRNGTFNLYQTSGSGPEELVLSTANIKVPNQWSRDGRFVVYSERDPKTHDDLWVLPVGAGASADRKPFAFLKTEFNELKGQLSADSRWMAYTSDESGRREVYVRPFPTGSGKWRISEAGGEQPRWRTDAKELFFVGADGKMMAVSVKAVADPKLSFEAGTPMPLFETHIGEGAGNVAFQYDVTADGKRFLVATTLATAAPPLNVVVNWHAGLKK